MSDADDLVLPVPELVSAVYLVPTTRPPDDPAALVRQDGPWPAPVRERVAAVLARSDRASALEVRPIDELSPPPVALLAATGADRAQLNRIASATHTVLVAVAGAPGWPPLHEWSARTVAVAIAARLHAEVIDLVSREVLTSGPDGQDLPGDDGVMTLSRWVRVAASADPSGTWMTTTGLRRFGLPELQTHATPPNLVEEWGRVVTGIARVLLRGWSLVLAADPQAAFVALPATLEVTRADVRAAHRPADLRPGPGPGHGPGSVRVRLGLDPRTDPEQHSFLTVHPPLDWSGSAGEHMADACATLFGPRSSEIRHAHRSDVLEVAIALARANLTSIRRRFEAGELGRRTKLLVKYALPAEGAMEYLWAYVTSWRDPYRILATSAADAVYHPRVRLGRPVVVDTATVVDWAVEHDEQGIVEGYWTRAALDPE